MLYNTLIAKARAPATLAKAQSAPQKSTPRQAKIQEALCYAVHLDFPGRFLTGDDLARALFRHNPTPVKGDGHPPSYWLYRSAEDGKLHPVHREILAMGGTHVVQDAPVLCASLELKDIKEHFTLDTLRAILSLRKPAELVAKPSIDHRRRTSHVNPVQRKQFRLPVRTFAGWRSAFSQLVLPVRMHAHALSANPSSACNGDCPSK